MPRGGSAGAGVPCRSPCAQGFGRKRLQPAPKLTNIAWRCPIVCTAARSPMPTPAQNARSSTRSWRQPVIRHESKPGHDVQVPPSSPMNQAMNQAPRRDWQTSA
jgi:hypothetical protein